MQNVKKLLMFVCAVLLMVTAGAWFYSEEVNASGLLRETSNQFAHQHADRLASITSDGVKVPPYKLAVIIDDFGNGQKGTEQMLKLPIKITVAVMPFLPTSKEDAEQAHKMGHDVIIHMPMEPKQGKAEWLGPGAITSNMTDEEVRKQMELAIEQVPHAVGVNNHMGSKITGDKRIMSVILDVCKEHGLFFIDSKTNYHSVAGAVAAEKGMPNIGNHIFLDDVHTVQHVTKQLKLTAEFAEKNKTCITIGHVGVYGERTAAALQQMRPELKQRVQFVGIEQMVQELTDWSPNPLPTF